MITLRKIGGKVVGLKDDRLREVMTMQKESKIQQGHDQTESVRSCGTPSTVADRTTLQKERDRKNRNNEEYVQMLAEQYHKEMPHLTLEQIKRELSLVM